MSTLVINAPTRMCCGLPAAECQCQRGEYVVVPTPMGVPIHNFDKEPPPTANQQKRPDTVVKKLPARPVLNVRKPTPLGLPNWDFGTAPPASKSAEPVTNRAGVRVPTPLGLPDWDEVFQR